MILEVTDRLGVTEADVMQQLTVEKFAPIAIGKAVYYSSFYRAKGDVRNILGMVKQIAYTE